METRFLSTSRRWIGLLFLLVCLLAVLSLPPIAQVSRSNNTTTARLLIPKGRAVQPGNPDEEQGSTPRPDNPGEAVAFRRMQLQDENGYIPPDGLRKASERLAAMRPQSQPEGIVPSSIGIFDWTWLGPGNIGGRIRSILVHPTTPSTLWVGGVAGGVWKTTDGGTSWTPTNDFMANLAISSLVMDPGNPNVLYAGTGEGFHNFDAIRGAGVFKSTNGGSNWTQLPSTDNLDWSYVNRLAINPSNGQILLAATISNTMRTTNGGLTWTKEIFTRTLDVKFDPSNGNRAIAGGGHGNAWYSTDGGITWYTASWDFPKSDAGRVELAYAPSNPNIVYASVERAPGGHSYGNALYRSGDGGHSFVLKNENNYLGTQGWYGNAIWVDPTNASTIIVGGIDLWRSVDAGNILTKISQWDKAPSSAHADHHVIVADPGFNGTSNKTVYFGNDGGIYKTTDVYNVSLTSGWQELNNNLGITQFYGAAGNPNTGVIVGGTQDNGTLRYAGGAQTWTSMFGGDGGYAASDPTDPNYFYGEYVGLQIHRSTNGGLTSEYIDGAYWNGTNTVWKSPPYRIDDAYFNGYAPFIAAFILDPNNANRLLAGGVRVWRTNDAKTANTPSTGPSWASIKDYDTDGTYYYYITAIAVATGNSDLIYVGHSNGHLYKTTNGTAVTPIWTRVDTNSPGLPGRWITRITVDPNNPNIVYVTYSGFSQSNVWRSANGGGSWTDIAGTGNSAGDLPLVPVRTLAVNPKNSSRLYVGTEVGIFESNDSGATWSTPQNGPANVSVDELFWVKTDLIAATHGRGIYRSPAFTIISPLSGNPGSAGNCTSPSMVQVKVTKPSTGLTKNDFVVKVGGKNATISSVYEYPDEYRLYIYPPTQKGVGAYSLNVATPNFWIIWYSDLEPNAVSYSGTSCSQIFLPFTVKN